jgi:hypothetical protein
MGVPFAAYGAEIYLNGLAGERPALSTDPARLEAAARSVLDDGPFGYVAGGAGGGATMRANRAAFDRYAMVPRMLRDTRSGTGPPPCSARRCRRRCCSPRSG